MVFSVLLVVLLAFSTPHFISKTGFLQRVFDTTEALSNRGSGSLIKFSLLTSLVYWCENILGWKISPRRF